VLTLLLPPRQRDEARALMARALAATERGGRLVVAAPNNEGARSMQADLEKLGLDVSTLSKHKCRVCWSSPLERYDTTLAAEWRELDRVQTIAAGAFLSRPGIFAWDRIDPASALLANHLRSELAGRAADLGAGFGYLSVSLLNRCAGITRLDIYEAESRALELARLNTARIHSQAELRFYWHDVAQGLFDKYDVIVTNPPFHAGTGVERPDVGRRFITAAADALRPGGRLLLVANKHLPYEAVLDRHFGKTRIVTQEHGFKIVEAVKTSGS
jgi:16S rRNA (guanine1207-N2)-methyltransferase